MKKILYSILIAGLTLASAACQKVDEKSAKISGDRLKVTATIASFDGTKVNYAFESGAKSQIKPTWSEGDKIFGFDDKGGKFTFTVTSVDTESRRATFDVNGEYAPEDGTVVYGVYYPGKAASDFDNGELDVDIASQSGILGDDTPVIMCATATVSDGAISFEFANQTAIVGIYKMQIKEGDTPVSAGIKVSGVSIKGVCAKGTIKVDGGEFKLVPGEETETVSATGLELTTEADGFIEVDPESIAPYFSVIPGASTMFVEATSADKTYYNISPIDPASLTAGNYYYIGKVLTVRPVAYVTPTDMVVTPEYYGSLQEAVAAANSSDKNVTITILENCSAPAQTIAAGKTITLDLDGKTVKINGKNGRFIVKGTMILEDGSSSKTGVLGVDDETCTRAIEVSAGGVLTINSGTVEGPSKSSNGHFTIYVGEETGDKATFTMNGGALNGHSQYGTLYARNAQCTLSAGTIYSKNNGTNESYLMARAMFLQSDADVTVSEGMNISAESAFGNSHCIHFANKAAKLTVNGGVFKAATAVVNFGTASGQYIVNGGYFNSAAVGVGSNTGNARVHAGYYTFEPELVEGGFAATDISANPEVKDGVTYNWTIEESSVPVATLTVGSGDPQPFTAVDDAFTTALAQAENSECTIQLLEDCEIGSKIDITKKIKLMLDLNGKTLTLKGTNRINLSCEGAEYIIDDKSGSEGTYQQTSTSSVYVSAVTGGKLIVNKGNITHSGTSSAIYLNTTSGSTTITGFEMNGGSVVTTDEACTAVVNVVSDKAEVLIKGGSLTMSNNTGGYALYFQRGKSVTVEDGTLTSSGMAIRAIAADGNLNISGGKFVGDTTSLYMTKGNLNIIGGEFSVSTTKASGCIWGVIDLIGTNSANMGTVRISNAKVIDGKQYKAIYVRFAPDMEISSGEFSAVRHVVYVGYATSDNSNLTISGGSFKATGSSSYPVIYNGGKSKVTVTGGYFYRTNTSKQIIFQTSDSGNATTVLSGGYCNMDPQASIDLSYVSLAAGCSIKSDGEGDYKYYIVKE